MAGFNTKVPAQGPVRTTDQTAYTHQGAPGYARDAKSELFLGCVTHLVEDAYYETAAQRRTRLQPLISEVARTDPTWLVGMIGWLRSVVGLRSVPILVAAEAVHARLAGDLVGHNRDLVTAALRRADEPGEFLGYWTATFGRPIPSAVKRGLGDALGRLDEYAWLKWRGKGERGEFSLADVLNLTHPKPNGPVQEALFGAVLAHGYGREPDTARLPMVTARARFLRAPRTEQEVMLADGEFVERAGLTHEVVAGAMGSLDAATWTALVPRMGFQALLMNLRRIDQAQVGARTRVLIAERLRNPEQVRRSRMLPIRFLSAYRNAPLEFAGDLEVAAQHVLSNVPSLPGRTLVLVDRSGSMNAPLSGRSTLTRVDAANMFGAALALRAEAADLVAFGTRSVVVPFRKNTSLLRLADAPANLGGTYTADAVNLHYRQHTRIVVVTDEQSHQGGVFDRIPENVSVFTWNVAGYRPAHAASGANRYAFGGLSDAGFSMITALEQGRHHRWPWEG